ncbi:hypothetical protein KA478_01265 [Patescibacteria group bacterium]|nr:hypothetical protein [Patescibacteria group bacterium]
MSVKDMGTNVIHLVSDDHIVYAPYIWESYGSDTETTIENINTAKKLLLTNIIPVSLDLQTNIFHYSQHEYDLVPMPSEECPPRNMGNVCIDGKIYNQENHRNTPKTIALP